MVEKDLNGFRIFEKAQENKVLKELKVLINIKKERLGLLYNRFENGHPNIDKLEELIEDLEKFHKRRLNYWKGSKLS